MILTGMDGQQTRGFFLDAWRAFDSSGHFPKAPLYTVAHALGSHVPFFDQLEQCFGEVMFTVKARSQDPAVVSLMASKQGWSQSRFTESDIAYDPAIAARLEELLKLRHADSLYIIDVGGKWADGDAACLRQLLQQHRVHVVEGTENGYKKYELLLSQLSEMESSNLRVWSVARSSLKDAEDSLTGTAIVEATETIIRVNYGLLKDHPATVFGYGKIGRSVANALREKHLTVGVVEINPLLAIRAQADGFQLHTEESAQELGGYIFLATGSAKRDSGLHLNLLEGMKRNALVSFVTSVDDELQGSDRFLEEGYLQPAYELRPSQILEGALAPSLNRFRVRENLLECLHYLPNTPHAKVVIVNRGSPPNFLFEASCGPYIFLVFSGMLACLYRSSQGIGLPGIINELGREDEQVIGNVWLRHFVEDKNPAEPARGPEVPTNAGNADKLPNGELSNANELT